MNNGSWILLMMAAVVSVGYACYLLGRRSASRQAEIDRLEQELASAREKAEQVKAGVSSHFEQSAVLFGALARDYRAFLDHYSQSARDLGLSEGKAEDLLEQVARPLLASAPSAAPAQDEEKPETALTAPAEEPEPAVAAPPDQGEPTPGVAESTPGDSPASDEATAAVSGAEPARVNEASEHSTDDGAGKPASDDAPGPASVHAGDNADRVTVAGAPTGGDVPRPNGADRGHEEHAQKRSS